MFHLYCKKCSISHSYYDNDRHRSRLSCYSHNILIKDGEMCCFDCGRMGYQILDSSGCYHRWEYIWTQLFESAYQSIKNLQHNMFRC